MNEDLNYENQININYIAVCDNGLADKECRNKLIEFLSRKNHWKDIPELLLDDFPWLKYDSIEQFQNDPIIADPHSMKKFHINFREKTGLRLSPHLILRRDEYIDKDFFDFFFFFRLSNRQLSRVAEFLNFNLNDQFHSNLNEFFFYLKNVFLPMFEDRIGLMKSNLVRNYISRHERGKKRGKARSANTILDYLSDPLDTPGILRVFEEYKNSSPLKVAYLVFALVDMKLAVKELLKEDITTLHHVLTACLGKIGSRSRFNINMNTLRAQYPDGLHLDRKFKTHKRKINQIINSQT